jgi:hypothetical protein
MSVNRKLSLVLALGAVLFAALGLATVALAGRDGNAPNTPFALLEIEVAEDVTAVVFDEAPVYDDGWPAHGNPFITMGYIYPKGTLDGTNGVLYDGEGNPYPEFDSVLGTWICYGRAIGEAGHAATGPWAVSTQIFQFDEVYGNATLVTSGVETMEVGAPVVRAVTGGTGAFLAARGEATQALLGMHEETGAVNIAFAMTVLAK